MTIKLEKTEELNGEVWYRIWSGNNCIKSFMSEPDNLKNEQFNKKWAMEYYEKMVERQKQGYPKMEVIASETIETTQP